MKDVITIALRFFAVTAGLVPAVSLGRAEPRIEIPGLAFGSPGMISANRPKSLHVVSVTRQRINNCDLLHGEVRHDLDLVLLHDQHFLDADAVAEAFSVLRFEREGHAFLNVDRMIERPDA